jgi:putative phosphoesterase
MSTTVPRLKRLRRLAVLGDVHAEDQRLSIGLNALDELIVDKIVCTGDIVDGVGDVNRCCTLLKKRSVACVRGNHDRWLFEGILRDAQGATALTTLTEPSRDFISQLPAVLELPVLGGSALLCHGIGTFDLGKVTEYDTDYSLQANSFLQTIVTSQKYRLMIHGHSHTRLIRRVGSLTLVNSGALCGPRPGFTVLDFARNLTEWYSLTDSATAQPEVIPLECEP